MIPLLFVEQSNRLCVGVPRTTLRFADLLGGLRMQHRVLIIGVICYSEGHKANSKKGKDAWGEVWGS